MFSYLYSCYVMVISLCISCQLCYFFFLASSSLSAECGWSLAWSAQSGLDIVVFKICCIFDSRNFGLCLGMCFVYYGREMSLFYICLRMWLPWLRARLGSVTLNIPGNRILNNTPSCRDLRPCVQLCRTATPLCTQSVFIEVTGWPFHWELIPACSMILKCSSHINL